MQRTLRSFMRERALPALALVAFAIPALPARASNDAQRYLVISKRGHHTGMRRDAIDAGGRLVLDLPQIHTLVMTSSDAAFQEAVVRSSHLRHVLLDHVVPVAPPSPLLDDPVRFAVGSGGGAIGNLVVIPDPAFGEAGLLWNIESINAPTFWQKTLGDAAVKVGIADTGIDSTHIELSGQVASVVDFTTTENPMLCSSVKGLPTDDQLATAFSAPRTTDFHGHGSAVAGIVAAALNGTGVNGIAPAVQLVSLKIAQNCGLAYDSTILSAIVYAAANQIDVVNFSFSEYLDPTNPAQKQLYGRYVAAVKYALSQGTLIVAAAGDDHTRLGAGGKVVSHGLLADAPGGADAFGKFEVPGGIRGVLAVAATANVVNAPSASCPADSLAAGSHQWCKRRSALQFSLTLRSRTMSSWV